MTILLAIEKVTAGMVLDRSIKNKYGQLLIPENTSIEERHLKTIKTWGISSVYIKDYENEDDNRTPNEEQRVEWLSSLYGEYGWSPRNQNEDDLFEMILSLRQHII